MKAKNILFYVFAIIALAINVVIIEESFVAGAGSSSHSQGFTKMLIDFIKFFDENSILIQDENLFHAVVRKLFGHFLLFGGFGLFVSLTFMMKENFVGKSKYTVGIVILSIGLVNASVSELIQFFTPGRAGALTDILIDYSGYLLFALVIYFIFFISYIHAHKKDGLEGSK